VPFLRGVASLEEDSIVPVMHLKSALIRGVTFGGIGLIRGVASLEEDRPYLHGYDIFLLLQYTWNGILTCLTIG
jgi:hypothetical protein